MSAYTVAYQPEVEGFTSFFSFDPEMMIGMNNYLYSFKNGQIWKHYINPVRNTFYATDDASIVDITINNTPTEVKLFKTFSFDGNYPDDVVSGAYTTYLNGREYDGEITSTEFTVKEGESYAFIRSTANSSYGTTLKDSGIGKLFSKQTATSPYSFTVYSPAQLTPPATKDGGSAYCDSLYVLNPSTGVQTLVASLLTGFSQSGNFYTYYCTAFSNNPALGSNMVLSKNIIVESFGLRGSYMNAQMTINTTEPVEIFSMSSEAIQSKP